VDADSPADTIKPARKLARKSARTRASDLGPVRLERQGGLVTLKATVKNSAERGFSLLIKEEGYYTLEAGVLGLDKNLVIHAKGPFPLVFRNHKKGDCILRGGHKRSFSDILNRSVRSVYAAIITACDREGPLAFVAIGRSGDVRVFSRDGIIDGFSFSIKFEGINV